MTWRGDIGGMGRLADRIEDLARIPSRAAATVALELEALIEAEYEGGHDPYGEPWEPLAEATIAKGRHFPPLTDTGAMRLGSTVTPTQYAGVAIYIPHPGAPHQTGWSGPQGDGPARPTLPSRDMPRSWRDAIGAAVSHEARAVGAT
jgi:hypothetical protein